MGGFNYLNDDKCIFMSVGGEIKTPEMLQQSGGVKSGYRDDILY